MPFEYRHKYDDYRQSVPITIGESYSFENGENSSRQVYFSIAFFPRLPGFLKFKSRTITRFIDTVINALVMRLNTWLARDIKYLSIVIASGKETSEHKILFSGYGKYRYIYSDVLIDWVEVISNQYSNTLRHISITISALNASGQPIFPKFIFGSLVISKPLFPHSSKGRNIIFITSESLSDFDYLLKEKMISQNTYDLYKSVFSGFTAVDHGVAQGDWTFPIAFTYHSGLLPSQHKMFNSARICSGIDQLNEKITTLPEMLKTKGYLTFSATLGRTHAEYGFAKGFDFYFKPGNELGSFEYTGDDKWIINKLEQFESNCFIHVHLDRLHAPFCTTTGPWSRVKKFSTPELGEDDILINPESYYEKNLRLLLFEINNLISYLKLNNVFEETILIVTADHGTAIGEWFNICQKNSLVDSRVRIPYLINQQSNQSTKNANIRHIYDITSMLGIPLPDYFKKLPQNNEDLAAYSFSEAILKTRKDLYVLAIRNDRDTYFYFADIDWKTFSIIRFVEEYVVSSLDGSRVEDPVRVKPFVTAREKFFELNQRFYADMHATSRDNS